MQYLCDKHGQRVAYLNRVNHLRLTVHLLDGQLVAEVDEDYLYNQDHAHIGWRSGCTLYNLAGEIVLSQQADASDEVVPPSFARKRQVTRANRATARPMPFSFQPRWARRHGLAFLKASISVRPQAFSSRPPRP